MLNKKLESMHVAFNELDVEKANLEYSNEIIAEPKVRPYKNTKPLGEIVCAFYLVTKKFNA